jgi:hypothetical protein
MMLLNLVRVLWIYPFQLDYGDYIKEYIMKQKYESDKFKDGVVDWFDENY